MSKTFKKTRINKCSKKQIGGIMLKEKYINEEPIIPFKSFLENSTIELLTDGSSFGIIFKAILNPGKESPYEIFGVENFKEPVKNLLIKIVALSPVKLDEYNDYWSYFDGRTKQIDTEENFKKEVNIQTDIFFKTMEYLEPLCPAPVVSLIENDKNKMVNFMNFLKRRTNHTYTKEIIDKILENIKKFQIPSLGVLAMEIADGFSTLTQLYHDFKFTVDPTYMKFYEYCEQMGKLQILKLALDTGYSHNDFHRGNFLINPNYNGFYKGLRGKVILIDFGLSTKFEPETKKRIKDSYDNGKYQEALQVFETLTRSDGLKINEYPDFYGWLYNEDKSFIKARPKLTKKTDDEYDKIMSRLLDKEEAATDERVKYFDEKHSLEPDKYPLLPLSNKIKNSFFQGMIESSKRKTNTKTKKNTTTKNDKSN